MSNDSHSLWTLLTPYRASVRRLKNKRTTVHQAASYVNLYKKHSYGSSSGFILSETFLTFLLYKVHLLVFLASKALPQSTNLSLIPAWDSISYPSACTSQIPNSSGPLTDGRMFFPCDLFSLCHLEKQTSRIESLRPHFLPPYAFLEMWIVNRYPQGSDKKNDQTTVVSRIHTVLCNDLPHCSGRFPLYSVSSRARQSIVTQ